MEYDMYLKRTPKTRITGPARRRLVIFEMAWLMVAVGCGGNGLATVTGVVRLDGEPIEGASITFVPEGPGPLAYASAASGGSYKLQTGSAEGVKPGNYVATVSHRRGRPSPGMTIAQIEALEIVPVRYTTAEASDLRHKVAAGDNQIDLDLVSKP